MLGKRSAAEVRVPTSSGHAGSGRARRPFPSAPRLIRFGLALALAGCASGTLCYTPAEQPSGTPISADYELLADRLRVEIDTGGYRVEEAEILRGDGGTVRPQFIEHPSFRGVSGIGFGLGLGRGSWRGGVGVEAGVGVGVGVGRADANTFALFPLDQVGPAPWRLRVKVVGVQPVDIVLGR